MRKLLSSLLLFVVINNISAQNKVAIQQHLSFKGVPIDGTLKEFVSKMTRLGFWNIGKEKGMAIMKGDFASYKNCHVGVSTLKSKDLVEKIVVILPACDTWSSLSSNYFNLKAMLTEKYGHAAQFIEEFQSYIEPLSDDEKMYKVKYDECKYSSNFETELGTIYLSIRHDGTNSCFVSLVYVDKINSAEIKKDALDDL